MATETRTTVPEVEQPEVDVFSSYVVDRLPNPPVITLHFTPCVRVMNGQNQAVNTTGHPLHRGVASGYAIQIVCQGAAALTRLGTLMGEAKARIVAGDDLDGGITNEAEDLRNQLLTAWDTEAYATVKDLETAFGVRITGNHPFT